MKKIVEWGLLLIITGSVLAFGGVQSPAYTAMEVALFLLTLVVLVRQTIDGRIDLPLPLWILPFLCLVLLQTIPLPVRVVSWLSPNRLFPGLQAALTLGAAHWATLNLYPHDTLLGFFKLLAYLAAFVLAAYAFEAREGKNVFTPGLIVLGSLEAAYGMVQYLTGYQKIFGFTKQFYTDDATGTYINHNHFAGFLELVIPFAVMMVFYNLQSLSAHGVPERRRLRGSRYSLSLTPVNPLLCVPRDPSAHGCRLFPLAHGHFLGLGESHFNGLFRPAWRRPPSLDGYHLAGHRLLDDLCCLDWA